MRHCFTLWAGLIIFVSVLAGCSSTTLTTSSKNGQFAGTVNKVYIIGFADNQETRQHFEDSVAASLSSYGVAGISSYQDQPVLAKVNDEAIDKSVKSAGADALLLTIASGKGHISRADIIKPDTYKYELIVRGNPNYGTYPQPYYKRYGTYDHVPRDDKPYGSYRKTAFADFYSFGNPNRQEIYTPPTGHETITMATYLFDTRTKELIWSAELEAKSSSNRDKAITDFINTVTADLKKHGLI